MSTIGKAQATGGVEQLLARLRDEGVGAARQEAERILAEARDEAAATRERARAEAAAMLESARSQVAIEQDAGQEALRLAARDTLLELRATIRRGFEAYVSTMVSRETSDASFVRDLVLVIAGHAAEGMLQNKQLQILLGAHLVDGAEVPAGGALEALMTEHALGLGSEMLRQGIELFRDDGLGGGARVRLVGQNLELDLSDRAISRMLLRFLIPRYRHIVEQPAGGA
jgi:V/A-type H+/Na+-transporting ATPase subunit E